MNLLLSNKIRSSLSPSNLPAALRSIRGALFPNNAPGKSSLVPPATEEDLVALRRRAATALWGLLPKPVATIYLGGGVGQVLLPLRATLFSSRFLRSGMTTTTTTTTTSSRRAGGSSSSSGGGANTSDGDGSGNGNDKDENEDESRMIDEMDGLLDVLSDEYCNKHLLYGILELILVRLIPELSDKSVQDLLDDRLG
ncbi:hypothetical protein GMORB2_2186 [Geosmithia morbida]|uniref:Uncharacterized protein n=1 Tax=Geosmithia morbida TaxID=1094350 RepID=A0A9P4YSZ2_9HYPO|nr:uncharacterized protein GMORB2_2186 [Geosmithia morbida]KAF4121224.1 hypothetical protein GMORB2_2186 [Geosmithia morbida]